ncbi:MAG: hypothetical protein IH881_02410 [Myxococcales bacterium]|nr:hypothetical protein [Myxococcales bacterium]
MSNRHDFQASGEPRVATLHGTGAVAAARYAGPVLMAVVGACAFAQAWPMGPDIQVDFGRELYVPWRISEGDRLYSDIAYFNGPLSSYWNALWFSVFGIGLSTLKIVNLSITIAIAGLFYRILATISDRFSASVAGIFFTGAIAFGQSLSIGNYNYLTPYSHELTHGLALSLLGLACLAGLTQGVDRRRVALQTGALAALVFLTKAEVFAAFAVALFIGFALEHWTRNRTRSEALEVIRALSLSFALLLIGFSALLSIIAGPATALSGIVEPWQSVTNSSVTSLPYYRWVMGTLNVSRSLGLIAEWLIRYGIFIAALIGLSLAVRGKVLKTWAPLSVVAFAALVFAFPAEPAFALQAPRPLAILVPLMLLGLMVKLVRQKQRGVEVSRLNVSQVVVLAFCLVLQLKMALNTQFNHYGFALVVPSALVFIVMLINSGSALVERFSGSQWVFRLGVAAAVAWIAIGIATRTQERFADRPHTIGRTPDQMRSDTRARYVERALDELAKAEPGASVAVLPEGVMLNYLTRRVNPTPYINFMPPEMLLYGETEIIEAFKSSPPDYVVFMHKNTRLYGYEFFGRDYGRRLYRWVLFNYNLVQRIGPKPFEKGAGFGITIYERSKEK